MPVFRLIVSLLLFSIAAGPLHAAERPRLQGDGVTVVHDASLQRQAELLAGFYPRIRAELEDKIGWKLRAKPVVFLIADSGEFVRMGGNSAIAAFASFPKGHIIVNMDSITPHFILLSRTFRHELAHVLLHERIRGRNLPHWLDEGVSEWASAGEEKNLADRIEEFTTAFGLHRNAVPLEQLSQSFPRGGRGTLLAYTESRSFIEYVVSRYGKDGLTSVLARLEKGDGIDRAFLNALSTPLPTVEKQWRDNLRHKVRWFSWAAELPERATGAAAFLRRLPETHPEEICAALAGFLVLLACWKAVRRRKPRA